MKAPLMKSFRLLSALAFAVTSIVYFVIAIPEMVVDLVMTPFRADYGNAWRFVQRFALASFRTIGALKPAYRDSYQTNGQSFGLSPGPA
jgi:hypothetical protein